MYISPTPESLSAYFARIGKAGGLAAARAMSPQQRQERARACTIGRAASRIAGCLWEDREKTGTLAEQLQTVANTPIRGTDGNLTPKDRTALLALAKRARSTKL